MPWYNPDDPIQRNWMLAGVAFLVLIVPYSMYVLTPRQEENAQLLQRVESLETVNRRASVLAAQGGGDLQERLALYEAHVAELEQLIPARDEVPALVDDINTRARLMNVDVREMQPQPREPGEHYDLTGYNMAVVGEYHNVARFLTEIASLPRIVTPVQVEVARFGQPEQYRDLESPVAAIFRIETYVLPEPSSDPAPAQIGG
ncbi:MAG TPA: type 4a pilus biogenesis protein PilO [Longimicrobiales bacterium]|nr:type 4a pilus biogenesis protein PilO [Longimicrobiales bacterium]